MIMTQDVRSQSSETLPEKAESGVWSRKMYTSCRRCFLCFCSLEAVDTMGYFLVSDWILIPLCFYVV